jgi:CRP-like cAMP-binding protein
MLTGPVAARSAFLGPTGRASRPKGSSMAEAARTGNLLLDALRPHLGSDVVTHAGRRRIEPDDQIVCVGDDVRSMFFPTSGTLSMLAEPDPDSIVEASTIGREGAADVFAALGSLKSIHRLIGQVPGEMIVLDAKAVLDRVSERGRAQTLLFSYIQALYAQAAISAACNAKHHVDQRAARWLLQTHDRVDSDTFNLKQEFLAYMLGVERPTVSLAAQTLKRAGLINYSRGTVSILDRFELESVACPCYEQIRKQYSLLVQL